MGRLKSLFRGGEDSHFGFRVRFLLLGETELSARGIDAHPLEDVGHVVVKHVQQETAIRLQLLSSTFLCTVPRACVPVLEASVVSVLPSTSFDIRCCNARRVCRIGLPIRSCYPLPLRFSSVSLP